MRTVVLGLTCCAALVGAGVALACTPNAHTPTAYTVVSPPRDWTAHPAILDLPAPTDLFAVSDPHGGYDRFAALLVGAGILGAVPATVATPIWNAGRARLVVVGDLLDKGPQAIEIIDMLMALETAAATAGGQVVVLLGNHEAEFFADPSNSKAAGSDGVDEELRARGIDPVTIASGQDPRGQWLRDRPFGVRFGGWFFSHAGDTHGRTLGDLSSLLAASLDAHRMFDDANFIGDDSILESRAWYDDTSIAPRYLAALGVQHIVFGHDPNALGPRGAIAVAQNAALLRIDCGMSPDVDDSTGKVLHVTRTTATGAALDVAIEIDPQGATREIWRGPS